MKQGLAGFACALAAAGLLSMGAAAPAFSADTGWISQSKADFQSKRMRATGQIPVTVDCKRETGRSVYRITSAPNADDRNWALIVMDDNYNWRAGDPGSANDWKKVSGSVADKGGVGQRYCSVYHHKQAGTFERSPPTITRIGR